MNDPGSTLGRGGEGIFFFATASRPALRSIHPPIQWVLGGGGGSFPDGKAARA